MADELQVVESTRASTVLKPPWQPGQSGNPSGRRSDAALRAALKPFEQLAYDAIRDALKGEDLKLRAENAWKLLERLYGKPEAVKDIPAWLKSKEELLERLS